MLLAPAWYECAFDSMTQAARRRGRSFRHYLQTNLIAFSERWNSIITRMFGGEIGTSMDFPNVHRKLNNGSAHDYTRLWLRHFTEAKAAGFKIGVIAVIHPETLDAGAGAFWRWFTEIGVESLQINTPFPGGPASEEWPRHSPFDLGRLTQFTLELFDLWIAEGFERGIRLGPFDELVEHFAGRNARLPCIWQENCANQFIAIDAKGAVAQCDCWVTSYPDWSYGNIFEAKNFAAMLRDSSVRQRFLRRPQTLVQDADCLQCRYLSICHGGCPVRAFTATGHLFVKDPYCEMYKALFERAEHATPSTNG